MYRVTGVSRWRSRVTKASCSVRACGTDVTRDQSMTYSAGIFGRASSPPNTAQSMRSGGMGIAVATRFSQDAALSAKQHPLVAKPLQDGIVGAPPFRSEEHTPEP